MLPILINYKVIHDTSTYWEIILCMIIPYLTAETNMHRYWQWLKQYCWEKLLFSAHQAVRKYAEHHIDMVGCVHRKWQNRDGVSRDVNKTLECVTITNSKFLNRVMVWMTTKSTCINYLLLLKKVSSARLGESDIHPISPKTPTPQYQPIDRKKRKGKKVEDYSRIQQLRPREKHWPCSWNAPVPHHRKRG